MEAIPQTVCICPRCGSDATVLEWSQVRLFASAVAHSADYAEAAERAGLTGMDPLAVAANPVVQTAIVLALKERIGYTGDSVHAVAVAEAWGALQAAKAAEDWTAVPRLLKLWQEAQAGLLADTQEPPTGTEGLRRAYGRIGQRAAVAGDLRTSLEATRSLDALEGASEAARVRSVAEAAGKLGSGATFVINAPWLSPAALERNGG